MIEDSKKEPYKHNLSHNIEIFYDSQMKFLWEQNLSPDISGTLSGSGTMTLYCYKDTLKEGRIT